MKDPHPDKFTKSMPLNLAPAELSELLQKQFAVILEMQQELCERIAAANRDWSIRAKTEADLASELTAKVTAARSLPEAMTAYQEWASRRVALITDDSRRILADGQKFIERGARLLSDGWKGRAT